MVWPDFAITGENERNRSWEEVHLFSRSNHQNVIASRGYLLVRDAKTLTCKVNKECV